MCSVSYAALNFRDIMLATGKLAQEAIPGAFNSKLDCLLGLEFSGRDTDGNRIMGQTPYKVLYFCEYFFKVIMKLGKIKK